MVSWPSQPTASIIRRKWTAESWFSSIRMNGCAICHRPPPNWGFRSHCWLQQDIRSLLYAGYHRVSNGGYRAPQSTCVEQVLAPLNHPSLGGEGVARLCPISGVRVFVFANQLIWECRKKDLLPAVALEVKCCLYKSVHVKSIQLMVEAILMWMLLMSFVLKTGRWRTWRIART